MSSKKKVSPKEVETVVETEPEVIEEEVDASTEITEAEEVQEEKPKKKGFVKRFWPVLVGMGVAVGAFILGKASSSSDEAAMAALEREYPGDGKEQDGSDTSTEGEGDDTPEDTEKKDENS